MRRRILLLALFAVVLAASAAGVAVAHTEGYSAVTSDERLVYRYNSSFGPQIVAAAGQWDFLDCYWSKPGNSCPGVDFQNVNQTTHAPTMEISDYCKQKGNILASTWVRNSGPLGGGTSTMTINKCQLNKEKNVDKIEVIAHEFGHAIGLAHPLEKNDKYWPKHSLMACCDMTPFVGPAVHDVYDYYYMWVAP